MVRITNQGVFCQLELLGLQHLVKHYLELQGIVLHFRKVNQILQLCQW